MLHGPLDHLSEIFIFSALLLQSFGRSLLFGTKLEVVGQPPRIKFTARISHFNGATSFPLMPTVIEPTVAGNRFDLIKQGGHPFFTITELQLTHTGTIEQQAANRQQM